MVCIWILCIAIFLKWLVVMLLKGLFEDWIVRADEDEICAQLAVVDWYALFLGLGFKIFFGNLLIALLFSTTELIRRTGNPGLIKTFVIWTTSRLNHTNT
jgi:hypothetical protein